MTEALAGHCLNLARCGGTHHNTCLGHPLAASHRMVVITQTSIDGEPREEVLTEVHIACKLVGMRV